MSSFENAELGRVAGVAVIVEQREEMAAGRYKRLLTEMSHILVLHQLV
jgi:hypothetical protein